MRPIYTPLFITISFLACITAANGQAALQFSENVNGGAPLSGYDISRVVNQSNMLLSAIAFEDASSEGDELLLIGDVAISSVAQKLENLSREGKSPGSEMELVETRELAILYSDISHSLGVDKIPIALVRLGPERRIMPISDLSEERAMLNRTIIDENLFLSSQPAVFAYETSDGKRESSSGVDVIWS